MYPRISIITIVKNGMPFIENTLKSVLNQSYKNIEYIVVDGVSTDGTLKFVEQYFKSQRIILSSELDLGIADAFNKGLNKATGDYLLFLNADDALADSHVIEIVAKEIVKNNSPMFLYGDCNILERQTGEIIYRDVVNNFPNQIMRGAILPHPTLFANKKYFDQYGCFDLDFKIAMDFEWMIRGGIKETVVHIPLLVSAVRNGGLSGRVSQKKVANEIILALKKNGYISNGFQEIRVRCYFALRRAMKFILSLLGLYNFFVNLRHFRSSN